MRRLCALMLAALLPLADAAERAIDKTIVVAAPLADAWAAWTTREGIVSFFAPDARIEARVGGPFEVYIDPGAPPGQKGADDMRVLAIQPMKMLSFDWNAPPSLPLARQQRTVVIVRFVPLAERSTQVTLHHVGWGDGGEWDKAYEYFDRSWSGVLGSFKQRMDSGTPRDWAPWLELLRKMREARTTQ